MKQGIFYLTLSLFISILFSPGCSKKSDPPTNNNNQTPPEILTGRIVFVSNNDGDNEIYTINADGTNQKRLTNNTVDDNQPSWSPNGTRIAFKSAINGKTELFVMDSAGNNNVQITSDAVGSNIEEDYPSWSPDGLKLIYESYQDASSEPNGTTILNANIYSANSNGSGGYSQITSHLFYDGEPAYAPAGGHIAFVHAQVDTLSGGYLVSTGYRIYVMSTTGSNWIKLTDGPNDLHPKFSPDGTKIVYDSDAGICIVNLTGAVTGVLPYGGNPSFSPDGNKIVFDSGNKIYVMNVDGSGVKEIPTVAYAKQPAWTQ